MPNISGGDLLLLLGFPCKGEIGFGETEPTIL